MVMSPNSVERTDVHQAKFQDVDTLTQAHATNIQELNQTALQLREHQDVMGSLLGKRGDNLIQQAGRLDERVNDLEAHQTSLDQTLETNQTKYWPSFSGTDSEYFPPSLRLSKKPVEILPPELIHRTNF